MAKARKRASKAHAVASVRRRVTVLEQRVRTFQGTLNAGFTNLRADIEAVRGWPSVAVTDAMRRELAEAFEVIAQRLLQRVQQEIMALSNRALADLKQDVRRYAAGRRRRR